MIRILALALPALLSGCAWMAVATAPAKQATAPTERSTAVAARFWDTLHGGRYDDIDAVVEQHLQVLLEQPGDATTVAHLGFLNVWKLGERTRAATRSARAVESATLSRRYFAEAVKLQPDDVRFAGFHAAMTMAEGRILGDEKQQREGYYLMKDAVARWPEFNLFTSGYVMSGNPVDSPQFREGLAQQWATLDLCFGQTVSRDAPRFDAFMSLETTTGPKRACWNSWIAPHNWEGFFLNFGDMLVRAGDLRNARAMYEATRLSPTYAQWPYRGVAERRLAQLPSLPARFASPPEGEKEFVTMFDSAFGCMGCHQASGRPSVGG